MSAATVRTIGFVVLLAVITFIWCLGCDAMEWPDWISWVGSCVIGAVGGYNHAAIEYYFGRDD